MSLEITMIQRHRIFNTKVLLLLLDPSNFQDLSASQILISWVHLCQHLWSKALYLSSFSFRKLPISFLSLILMWLHASGKLLKYNWQLRALISYSNKHQHWLKGICVIKGWSLLRENKQSATDLQFDRTLSICHQKQHPNSQNMWFLLRLVTK